MSFPFAPLTSIHPANAKNKRRRSPAKIQLIPILNPINALLITPLNPVLPLRPNLPDPRVLALAIAPRPPRLVAQTLQDQHSPGAESKTLDELAHPASANQRSSKRILLLRNNNTQIHRLQQTLARNEVASRVQNSIVSNNRLREVQVLDTREHGRRILLVLFVGVVEEVALQERRHAGLDAFVGVLEGGGHAGWEGHFVAVEDLFFAPVGEGLEGVHELLHVVVGARLAVHEVPHWALFGVAAVVGGDVDGAAEHGVRLLLRDEVVGVGLDDGARAGEAAGV